MAARPIVTTTVTAAHGDAEAPVGGGDVLIAVVGGAVGAVVAAGAVVADEVAVTLMLEVTVLVTFKAVLFCPMATETSSATRKKAIQIIVVFSIIGDSNTARAYPTEHSSSNKFLFLAMPFILSFNYK